MIKIILNALYGACFQLSPVRDIQNHTPKLLNELDKKKTEYEIKELNNEIYIIINKYFKAGLLFNPYYASIITSHTRRQLLEPFLNNKKNGFKPIINDLCGCATDSLIMKGNIDNLLSLKAPFGLVY